MAGEAVIGRVVSRQVQGNAMAAAEVREALGG
jgi:hypothetical protein